MVEDVELLEGFQRLVSQRAIISRLANEFINLIDVTVLETWVAKSSDNSLIWTEGLELHINVLSHTCWFLMLSRLKSCGKLGGGTEHFPEV